MGDNKCALDDCRRPPSRDSRYCYFHIHKSATALSRRARKDRRIQELTTAAKTIFPTSGKFKLLTCRILGSGVLSIRYEEDRARESLVLSWSRAAIIGSIEIEIYSNDLSQLKAEMRSALANLRRAEQKKQEEWRSYLASAKKYSARRGSSSRQNRWLPSNDDDINSVDGGPPSEASDDDG